ncbi:hypothetical protein BV898_03263 [Hypsibius exemplaris]|uniref:MARVEL domain-containing protein n=1 Tax=Hypsibius exemplaris TaxID=2072580 RepID=A0A1W0X656_HYPEX|nr:hypothetical protein BV898_03263 [Hypsibius exemplaris]
MNLEQYPTDPNYPIPQYPLAQPPQYAQQSPYPPPQTSVHVHVQQQPQPPANHTVHTTVILKREGCCGVRARVKWVIGFIILFGIASVVFGAQLATPQNEIIKTFAGLTIAVGSLMITAGVCLAIALSHRAPALFTVWYVLFGFYVALNIAFLGYVGYIYTSSRYTQPYADSLLAGCAVNFVLQMPCLLTVISYHYSPLYHM